MHPYLSLAGAIALELCGTTALKASDGFASVAVGGLAIAFYVGSFYLLSLALVDLPVGLVYATWAGVGIVGLAFVGVVAFEETLDLAAVVGFGLVIAGVLVLNLYSSAYRPV